MRIKESLLIKARKPKLNGTERSMPLYIYPEGIEIEKTTTTTTETEINRLLLQPIEGNINRGFNFRTPMTQFHYIDSVH